MHFIPQVTLFCGHEGSVGIYYFLEAPNYIPIVIS